MSSRQWAVFDKDGKRVTPAVSDSIRAWEPLLRTDGYEDEELMGLIVRLQAEGYACRAVGIAPLMTPGFARKYARRHDNRNAWRHVGEKETRRYVESFFSQLVHANGVIHELELERLHLERRIARQRGMIRLLQARRAEAAARIAELKQALGKQDHEVCQTLGRALGYPPHDDPGAPTGAVCVGDHVAETLACEAATRIARFAELRTLIESLVASERYATRAVVAGQSREYLRARQRADRANSAIDEILGRPPGQQPPD